MEEFRLRVQLLQQRHMIDVSQGFIAPNHVLPVRLRAKMSEELFENRRPGVSVYRGKKFLGMKLKPARRIPWQNVVWENFSIKRWKSASVWKGGGFPNVLMK
jgi:hypothetical protein